MTRRADRAGRGIGCSSSANTGFAVSVQPAAEEPTAPAPLFRPEALAARRTQLVGEVLLTHRASSGWAALLAVVSVLAVVAFAVWGSYTRRAGGAGVLAPAEGVVQIQAPQAGVVVELTVTEGTRVKAGDVLFVLSTDRHGTGDVGYQQAISSSMRERLSLIDQQRLSAVQAAQADQQAQRDRATAMGHERAKLRDQLADMRRRADTAQDTSARYRQLLDQGQITRDQFAAKEAEAAELSTRIQTFEREDLSLQRELAGVQSSILAARARQGAADQAIEREAAGLREQLADAEARRRVVLTAPRDGVVTLLQAALGSAVAPGRPLATLVRDDSALQGTLYAPSRTVGFLKPGTPVWLRVAAFPHQKFGHLSGQVQSVSAYPAAPQEFAGLTGMAATQDPSAEPVYAVSVKLSAQAMASVGLAHPLRAGMRVDADFLLERRRLWEWALEPLLALPKPAAS